MRTGCHLGEAPDEFSAQHSLFLWRWIRRSLCRIPVGKERVFGGAYEAGDLDRGEDGRVKEEWEEAGQKGGVLLLVRNQEAQGTRTYRSKKDTNTLMSASQRNRSAAPAKRVGRNKSSASSRSDGRARLCGGARVGGVSGLLRCEPTDAATDAAGEGEPGVGGDSGDDGDDGGLVSSGRDGVRVSGDFCTLLIV